MRGFKSKVRGIEVKSPTLWRYIFNNPLNHWYVWIGMPAILIQIIVFKFLYPFAGFINGDSYVYIESAYHNFTVNTYPIGYSKLLRFFSVFTHSDTMIVVFQYFILQASTMAFIFTVFYFYNVTKVARAILFSFILFNPVFLYLANYISSDAFFLSLSMVWFTLLIWIMNRPTNRLIFINAFVLFIAFTVRYNALFYPIIGVVSLVLTRRRVMMNLIGFAIGLLFIGLFVQTSTKKYFAISGYSQFTPFTGWQIANNALYAYRYVDSSHRKPVPSRYREIDNMVRSYFDSSRDISTHLSEALVASTVYMWDPKSPLSIYMESKFKGDSSASALKKWSTVAPLMKEYGTFLIRSYPGEYAEFYLLPNAIKYYAPPVEFLEKYSTGIDSVNEIAKVWFDYKTNKIRCHFRDFNVTVLNFYPILVGTMNVVFVLSMISFIMLKGYRYNRSLNSALVLIMTLWAINFCFSVFASPIALRFQLFPILVSLSFTFLLVDFLIKLAWGHPVNETMSESTTENLSVENVTIQ